MTAPTPSPQPSPGQPAPQAWQPQQPGGNRGVVMVLAVVVALLVGVGIGYAIFGTGSDGGSDSDNLSLACQLHDDLADVDFFGDDGPGLDDPEFWELQGLGFVVTAHGYDVDDDDIVDTGRGLMEAINRFDEDLFDEAYGDLADLC